RRRQDDSEPASTGLFLCRLLHDSLTVVSLEDDRRATPSADLLPSATTARTSAFTHACALSLLLPLPSLDEPGLRCQLYLESAQARTFVKRSNVRLLLQLLLSLINRLQQPLHPSAPLAVIASTIPLTILIKAAADLSPALVNGIVALHRLPNDVLLAGSQKARSHLADLSGQLMRHLLIELDNLATAPTGQQAQQQHQRRRLRDLRLGLLCGLADHCDLTAPDTAALFGQLWQLTAASIDGGGDVQQARATLAQLRDRAAEWPEVAPRFGQQSNFWDVGADLTIL
uniref:DRIM domain-containing protein n=1 Tax=Macrostomum lignano TaxID=282301 RepID=A0A1I8FPH2_9PLAT